MAAENGDPPCTQCHVAGQSVDHSPTVLAAYPDDVVAAVVTTGISTKGTPIATTKEHKWATSDAERAALVTYLRGIDPRGFE